MLRKSGVAKCRNKRKNSHANEDENRSYLNNLVRGGARSHERTGLCAKFPINEEIIGNFVDFTHVELGL